jgi:DNA-binding NarL/FixJ family response regulator
VGVLTRDAERAEGGAKVQRTTVVGVGVLRSTVVEILAAEGLEVSTADGRDGLEEPCGVRAASLIVVIDEGPLTARSSTLETVRALSRDARVGLVRGSLEAWEARAALDAGAAGIVLTGEVTTALRACVLAVQAEQVSVPRRNRRQIEHAVLSAREKQILGLVVMGYMNSEIAERLFLAESTVKSHLSSAFSKLEVHSRHEAADLILNPDGGLALGILGLGGEPVQAAPGEGPVPAAPGGEPLSIGPGAAT